MTSDDGDRFRWRDAIICGLLWGVVVTLAVSLPQPVADLDLESLVRFYAHLIISWCCSGLVITCGCKLAEAHGGRWVSLPSVLIAAAVVANLLSQLMSNQAPGEFGHVTSAIPLLDLSVFDAWNTTFYGGIYALGYFTTRRTQRLQRRLAAMRAARSDAEAQLREARLRVVRGQMQPALLLDGLDALKRAYQRDRRAGEEMFDLLIAFLRAAMPGLRSGSSTVAAELTLVDRYTALREALDADALPWRLTLSEPPPDLAFPPLRLLPALDRLSRGAPRGAALEVTAAAKEGAFVIRIAVPAETPLSPALIDELRGGLRRDLGVNSLTAGDPRDPILAELRIHTQNPSAPAIFA